MRRASFWWITETVLSTPTGQGGASAGTFAPQRTDVGTPLLSPTRHMFRCILLATKGKTAHDLLKGEDT